MGKDAPKLPDTEAVIRRLARQSYALRLFELLLVIAVLGFNIFMLAQMRETQKQVRQSSLSAQHRQEQLLEDARKNSESDHQETIRYLRCILLLSPPRTVDAIDLCIAVSKLPDASQTPPISTPDGASTQGTSGAGRSASPKAGASVPATNAGGSSTPQNPPPPAQQNPIQRLLDPIVQPIQKAISGIL